MNHYEVLKNRIQKLTSSNQTILVFSFDPMVYCYSERRPASRFYFITPWIYNKKLLNELTQKIQKKNAQLILEDRTLKDFYPAIYKAVDKEYAATEAVEGYMFYVKKQ